MDLPMAKEFRGGSTAKMSSRSVAGAHSLQSELVVFSTLRHSLKLLSSEAATQAAFVRVKVMLSEE